MSRIRIALVGMGKIARDQHVPALAGDHDFDLTGAASPNHRLEGVPNFTTLDALLEGLPEVEAVAICTPPQIRYDIARLALERGRHVFLEKPPGATLNEVQALIDLAGRQGVALYASWHSQAAAAVEPARRWLAEHAPTKVTVNWKEDVREWHPGQTWIWKAGGLGVFDPAINALSILTHILPELPVLRDAELSYPSNCETPIAGTVEMTLGGGVPVHMEMDFLQKGPPSWDIHIETADGPLRLTRGGAVMQIGSEAPVEAPDREYATLYAAFAKLVRARAIDVDVAPFRLVADAFLCGRRVVVDPFVE